MGNLCMGRASDEKSLNFTYVDYMNIKDRYIACGQGHIFNNYDELNAL